MRGLFNLDLKLVIPAVVILSAGLVILSSIDLSYFRNQALYAVIGIICFFIFSSIDIRYFKDLKVPIYVLSLLLLLFLIFAGEHVRGSKRWVEIFGLSLQFSEVLKPFLLLSAASLFSQWQKKLTIKRMITSLLLFFPIVFLIFKQPDLGSALIFTFTYFFMLFYVGLSIWYILGGSVLIGILSPIIWNILHDYQKKRVLTFLDPQNDPSGSGYNVIQSTIAVGSGLLLGRGLGKGVQSQLEFLPERHTDFIFATFAEQFGFLGSFVLIVLYFLLLYRIITIAQSAEDEYSALVAYGAFSLLLFQVFVNIGMNIGLVPVTGVTLPMFSFGGSSLLSTMILLGFVNSISSNLSKREKILEIR